jgi:hypothetical protein
MFRHSELDPEEYREEQDPHNQQNVDVGLLPPKARRLVPRKVEQDHGCDPYGCTEKVKLCYPLLEGKILVFLFERNSGKDKKG